MLLPRLFVAAIAGTLLVAQEPPPRDVAPSAYDPLRTASTPLPDALLFDVVDGKRDRTVPIRVQLPAAKEPAPVVMLSHGLGGTRQTCTYLADHWAARGYVVVSMQHPGSDDSVWRESRRGERMTAMKEAASGKNLLLRCEDVTAVLDAVTDWNGATDHALAGRLDLEHVGMSGHSFGAMTTQVTGGQTMPVFGQRLTERRIDAALPMSPSAKERTTQSFGDVAIPWLLMTGTEDTSPIGDTSVADRLRVYPSLPSTIDRYELVLHGAEHSAFTERGLPGAGRERNPNHHRAILAISTAFWDTWLRGDAGARAWLTGDGPRSVLEAKDRWQHAAAEPASVR